MQFQRTVQDLDHGKCLEIHYLLNYGIYYTIKLKVILFFDSVHQSVKNQSHMSFLTYIAQESAM